MTVPDSVRAGIYKQIYTLEGAIQNTEFNSLSEDKKKELKEFSDFLKK